MIHKLLSQFTAQMLTLLALRLSLIICPNTKIADSMKPHASRGHVMSTKHLSCHWVIWLTVLPFSLFFLTKFILKCTQCLCQGMAAKLTIKTLSYYKQHYATHDCCLWQLHLFFAFKKCPHVPIWFMMFTDTILAHRSGWYRLQEHDEMWICQQKFGDGLAFWGLSLLVDGNFCVHCCVLCKFISSSNSR